MSKYSRFISAAKFIHPEHEESTWIVSYSKKGGYIGGLLGIGFTCIGLLLALSSGAWLRSHLGLYLLWTVASMVICFLGSIIGTLVGVLYGELSAKIKQNSVKSYAIKDALAEIAFRKRLGAILLHPAFKK